MKCAVITPVGPGHQQLAEECKITVNSAIQHNTGLFSDVIHLVIDDTAAKIGRSRARNQAVRQCLEAGIDWLFFLDADDLMVKTVFVDVAEYLYEYDAIWSNILELNPNQQQPTLRLPQVRTIRNITELVSFPPFQTIQMGHFVRTEIASLYPFNEHADTGEDFEYYFQVWQNHQAVKTREMFFINRRGLHSQGERSATPDEWRHRVDSLIKQVRDDIGYDLNSTITRKAISRCSFEVIAQLRSNKLVNSDNFPTLSMQFPFYDDVIFNSSPFPKLKLRHYNDDIIAESILWTGYYEQKALHLWNQLLQGAKNILDIGAYTGIFGLIAGTMDEHHRVTCLEPSPEIAERLKDNVSINSLSNVTVIQKAIGSSCRDVNYYTTDFSVRLSPFGSIVRKPLENAREAVVEQISVDQLIRDSEIPSPDLIKINTNGAELTVLEGMSELLNQKPNLLVSITANEGRIYDLLTALGYRLFSVNDSDSGMSPCEQINVTDPMKNNYYVATCSSSLL